MKAIKAGTQTHQKTALAARTPGVSGCRTARGAPDLPAAGFILLLGTLTATAIVADVQGQVRIVPVKVSEGTWDVPCEAVETVPFPLTPSGATSYPWPALRKTGQRRTTTFETVEIENGLVSVTAVPGLGGRVLALKSARGVVWPIPDAVEPQDAGLRGLIWNHGFVVTVGQEDGSGLAPLHHEVFHPRTEGSAGGVMTHSFAASGFDVHVGFTLEPGRADVLCEVHVHNRLLVPATCPVGLRVGREDSPAIQDAECMAWDATGDAAGFVVWSEDPDLTWGPDSTLWVGRLQGGFFGPRQTRVHRLRLMPLHDPGVLAFDGGLALGRRDRTVWAVSSTPFQGAMQLLDQEGRTLESPIDLTPGEVFAATLEHPVDHLAVLDVAGRVLADSRSPGRGPTTSTGSETESLLLLSAREGYLPFEGAPFKPRSAEAGFWYSVARGKVPERPIWGLAAVNEVQQAKREVAAGRFEAAIALVDQALLSQGDDPLLWWFKSACERKAGLDLEGEKVSLLNGRFLAPLDPVFRAETYLSTANAASVGPSPILRPLAEDPVRLLDVADVYIGHGLIADAARILDESLAHRPCPLAGYVLAWCLARSSNMAAEADIEVRKASKIGVVPPFPVRETECRAVLEWSERLPEDPVLAQWAGLVRSYVLPRYGAGSLGPRERSGPPAV